MHTRTTESLWTLDSSYQSRNAYTLQAESATRNWGLFISILKCIHLTAGSLRNWGLFIIIPKCVHLTSRVLEKLRALFFKRDAYQNTFSDRWNLMFLEASPPQALKELTLRRDDAYRNTSSAKVSDVL